jgi:hypothetical protein
MAEVQILDYRKPEVEEPSNQQEVDHRSQLVSALGFSPQFQCVDEVSLDASRYYEELTGRDLDLWMLFHRSFYEKSKGEWEQYHFDRVPTQVLEDISFADQLGVFDELEIWTPERRSEIDPMAVGVVGERTVTAQIDWAHWGSNTCHSGNARFFPIVRWGESLMSIEELTDQLVPRRIQISPYLPGLIPQGVLSFVRSIISNTPRARVFLDKAGVFAKHCGERASRLEIRTRGFASPADKTVTVCAVCGENRDNW